MSNRETLNLTEMRQMIRHALDSNTNLHIIGSPGIGKTAIIEQVGAEVKMPVHSLILAQGMPEDVGGALSRAEAWIDRLPLKALYALCEAPGILFLDEFTQANVQLQGAALTLLNERRAGDIKLHPGSRIILASNEAHEAASGNDLAPPAINRMTHIYVAPELREVQAYFETLGKGTDPDLHALAVDWSATLQHETGLLVLSPPRGAAADLKPWGSPRAWERALRLGASMLRGGVPDNSKLFTQAMFGNVGEETGSAFLSIRKIRTQLPSIAEIAKDPIKARIPGNDVSLSVGVLGVVAQVALQDPCAAWAYADRLEPEFRSALGRILLRNPILGKKSPFFDLGNRSRAKILGSIGLDMQG